MNKHILALSIALLFLASFSLTACDDSATGQDGQQRANFLQNVVTGFVVPDSEGEVEFLELEVSPSTSYFTQKPGFETGVVRTHNFFNMFSEIFENTSPNSVLAIYDNGTAVSVAIELSNPQYDPETGIVKFNVRMPDQQLLGNIQGVSVESRAITELSSPFESAFLLFESGSIDTFGGPCGDGANMVCPVIFQGGGMCINKNASPQCCDLSGTTCADCTCN